MNFFHAFLRKLIVLIGTFTELDHHQVVALASCFVPVEKSNEQIQLRNELAKPLQQLQESARRIAEVSLVLSELLLVRLKLFCGILLIMPSVHRRFNVSANSRSMWMNMLNPLQLRIWWTSSIAGPRFELISIYLLSVNFLPPPPPLILWLWCTIAQPSKKIGLPICCLCAMVERFGCGMSLWRQVFSGHHLDMPLGVQTDSIGVCRLASLLVFNPWISHALDPFRCAVWWSYPTRYKRLRILTTGTCFSLILFAICLAILVHAFILSVTCSVWFHPTLIWICLRS